MNDYLPDLNDVPEVLKAPESPVFSENPKAKQKNSIEERIERLADAFTGGDTHKPLTNDEIEAIKQKHIDGAIAKMKYLNAQAGGGSCKYCLGKGTTYSIRNGFEIVSHPCVCQGK